MKKLKTLLLIIILIGLAITITNFISKPIEAEGYPNWYLDKNNPGCPEPWGRCYKTL